MSAAPAASASAPPAGTVAIPAAALAARTAELAAAVAATQPAGDLLLVSLLPPGAAFASALSAALALPHTLAYARVSPYRRGAEPARLEGELPQLSGRAVLVVEGVVDTGLTLRVAVRELSAQRPASVEACVLLDRPRRRLVEALPLRHAGFVADDRVYAGYGIPWRGRLAELPDLCLVDEPR